MYGLKDQTLVVGLADTAIGHVRATIGVRGVRRVERANETEALPCLGALDEIVVALGTDLGGVSPFVRRVLEAVAAIAPGTTATYGEVAASIGAPSAARAVGQAVAANPVPIAIACHRVVRADGEPGGFALGAEVKIGLLESEGVTARRASSRNL
jgi:O-6-methylguanine DNA methyltransferase